MSQARRQRPSIAVSRVAVCATAAISMSMGLSASAHGSAASDRTEQTRYARETVNLTYTQFLKRKANFTRAGCNPDHKHGDHCRKPKPYDKFDWTTDGCSGFAVVSAWYQDLFRKPCALHDFGYRNFGKGLTLQRDENTRSWIDDRFKTEMVRLCNQSFDSWWKAANKVTCIEEAQLVWGAVRNLSDWSGSAPAPAGPGSPPASGPTPGASGPASPSGPPSARLAQGPAAPTGYRYAITLSGFPPATAVAISCRDSVDPGGFYSFSLTTDRTGSASTGAYCYSADGPDHWVVAGGVESNHVAWGRSAPPQPPPPPPVHTYPETTGGVAHTWTNYANAGGTQGPSIPSNATVQVTCKLYGFRVSDGNTWWYRIASSPWNDAYYVSADAFYNNGRTSGSLAGTPFVDENVRDC